MYVYLRPVLLFIGAHIFAAFFALRRRSPWRRREPPWLMDSQWNIVRFMLVQLLCETKLLQSSLWQRRVYLFILIYCPRSAMAVCVLAKSLLRTERKLHLIQHTHTLSTENLICMSASKEVKRVFCFHPKLPYWFKTQTNSTCQETAKRWVYINFSPLFYDQVCICNIT